MNFHFMADVRADPDGGFLVTFVDVPEAITHGDTRDEALSNGAEALGLALRGYCLVGRDIPVPQATEGTRIDLDAADAIKIAVIESFRKSGLTKTEFAKRIGKAEGEARRILDPDHATKLGAMQTALRALGKTLVISIDEAA